MSKNVFIVILLITAMYSCTKSEPYNEPNEQLFENKYCNDPEAINYNDGFPGTPDNSICIYPKDVFVGTYALRDSVLNLDFELDTIWVMDISVYALSNNVLRVTGFCNQGDSLDFTADRYYKATADSVLFPDSTLLPGQYGCRALDTLIGTLRKDQLDTNLLRINWTITSDTGINYHIGTAVKK